MQRYKKQAVDGVLWTFVQQFSVQLINFVVQIILARLLLPESFGLIAMINIFISIGQMLMDSGMTSSIIRTKNLREIDYSTVFASNIFISLIIYFLIYLTAPFIGSFYNQPVLEGLIRLYCLSFVIRSVVAVHIAKLTKEMNFKTQTKLQIPSVIVGSIIGVLLAFKGAGVWSIVWMNLTQALVFSVQVWTLIKWKPKLSFSREVFWYHFNFGYKITLSGLLDTIYNNAYNVVIGKFFSPRLVGFYTQADSLRLLPVTQLSTVINKVTYPLFSKFKSDNELKEAYRIIMQLVLFIVIPIMSILIVLADSVFYLLFGANWLPAVPYFQILAIASIFRPISTYNLNILKVKGESKTFLHLEVIKKIIGVIAIILTLPFGLIPLIWSLAVTSVLFTFLNAFYSGRLIDYRVREQLKDVYKLFLCGGVALGVTFVFYKITSMNLFLEILVLSLVYLSLYTALVYFYNKEVWNEIKKIIKK